MTPGFANPGGGDYHLLANSPLIEIGEPTAPVAGDLDLDGNPRAIDSSDPGCAARRDIGAYEFVPAVADDCAAPDTDATTAKPKIKTKKALVTWSFTSTEAGGTFECSLNGGAFFACSSPYSSKLPRGKTHTLTVRSKDASGNVDTSPDSAGVKIVKKKKKK